MVYSLPFSEPVGLIVGGVAGRMGANIGKRLASDWGWPVWLGAALGTLAAHYLAGALTKALINAGLLDAPGAAVSVAGTTPVASVAHSIIEGLIATSPDLSNALSEAIADALPSALAEVSEAASEVSRSADPRFSGGLQAIESIADSQGWLPSCGLETLENMVQSANPVVNNNLSDWALRMGYQLPLPLDQYQPFLFSLGIPSAWLAFDHNVIINAVSGNNTVALIGDAYELDLTMYKPRSFHAVTLRDPWYVDGRLTGYIGIDSNSPGQPRCWTFDQVERMSLRSSMGGLFANHILVTNNMASMT